MLPAAPATPANTAIVDRTPIAASYSLGVGGDTIDRSLYFSSLARGWELAAGGLLWLVVRWQGSPLFRSIVGWVGLYMVMRAAMTYMPWTPLPGPAALLPVAGTPGVLHSIDARWGPVALLGTGPLQWLGARSYGIYLWHWPLLILLEQTSPAPDVTARWAMLLADLMYRWIENFVRHSPRLVRSPRLSLAAGAALVIAVVGCSAAVLATAS